jgi:hypothetical protein
MRNRYRPPSSTHHTGETDCNDEAMSSRARDPMTRFADGITIGLASASRRVEVPSRCQRTVGLPRPVPLGNVGPRCSVLSLRTIPCDDPAVVPPTVTMSRCRLLVAAAQICTPACRPLAPLGHAPPHLERLRKSECYQAARPTRLTRAVDSSPTSSCPRGHPGAPLAVTEGPEDSEPPAADAEGASGVTLRHLLCHTSGIDGILPRPRPR